MEDSKLKDGEMSVNVGEGQHVDVNEGDVNVGEGQHVNVNFTEGQNVNVNVGKMHNDDDSKDGSFNYDSALKVAFDDNSDENDGFLEDELVGNLMDYDHGQDGTSKKHKQKWEEYKGASKRGENESEELDNECESEVINGATKKKYLMFNLQKDMTNFKWEIRTFFLAGNVILRKQ